MGGVPLSTHGLRFTNGHLLTSGRTNRSNLPPFYNGAGGSGRGMLLA